MATPNSIHRQLTPERGVDVRQPSTALLGLNSKDRYASVPIGDLLPTSPFDFTLSSRQN